jgi:Ca-activated chloride channel family protein
MSELAWGDLDAATWWFAVLAILLAHVGLTLWRRARLAQLAAQGPLPELLDIASPRRRGTRVVLLVLAAGLLVVALMRPQHGTRATTLGSMGIDIAIVLDASKSMKVPDVVPDRLEASKLDLGAILDGINGGRVSLVPFAGLAFVQTPLTHDIQVIRTYLEDLRVEDMPRGGTAIGRAILEAIRTLVPPERLLGTSAQTAASVRQASRAPEGVAPFEGSKYKAILLITDGEDHEGDPVKAAELAASLGIRIYTVGVGTPQGRPVPIINDEGLVVGTLKGPDGKTPLFSELNEDLLRQIARVSGGSYFQLGPEGLGDGLVTALDTLEKREYESTFSHLRDDRFQLALLPALLLLLLEAALSGRSQRRRRTRP